MERTSRTTPGICGTVMAMITVSTLERNSDTMAIASRMAGIAINPSMMRMMTASRMRKKPASRPMNRPQATLISATETPTSSETRAP